MMASRTLERVQGASRNEIPGEIKVFFFPVNNHSCEHMKEPDSPVRLLRDDNSSPETVRKQFSLE